MSYTALLLSSLCKVFADEAPKSEELKAFSMLKNERSSFQLAVCPDSDLKVTPSAEGFPGKVNLFIVRSVPSTLPCFKDVDDYYLRKEPGMFPDILEPVSGEITLKAGEWSSLWAELDPAGEVPAGEYEVTLGLGEIKKSVKVEIINAALPKQSLIHTNWYHCDGLIHYYNAPFLSDKFNTINENFIRMAVRHGVNCLLTPLFTPPLDTAVGGERITTQLVGVKLRGGKYAFNFSKLDKWIDLCLKCGVEYFEMSHLFTQWGARHAPKIIATDRKGREKKIFGWETRTSSKKYDDFLMQFGAALTKYIDKKGIRERCFFHVSDEPGERHIKTYKRRAALINKAFPGFTVIDALSDYEFYASGAVRQPIPETGSVEKFYGKVPSLWVYYCCGQGRNYLSNRFMAMPSQRTRVLGAQLFKYDVKGFLQWGYNFYNSQYSRRSIDPFKVTDAGGAFPSGDSFVVYPGKGGEPLPSIRIKVFYDAFQDKMALDLLASLIGKEKAVALVEEGTDSPITFRDYPHSDEWLLNMREKVNRAIKENI